MRIVDSAAVSRAVPGATAEDAVLLLEVPALAAVADGMGGPGRGDVASRLALDALVKKSAILEKLVRATETDRTSGARLALGRTLERLFAEVHAELAETRTEPGRSDRGTTLAVAVVSAGAAHIAHVGAVRAYLWRDGRLRVLTDDHTLGMMHVRHGRMTPSEYRTSPLRAQLTQALGSEMDIDVDVASVGLADRDVLMLCTDGVHRWLDDTAIARALGSPDWSAEGMASALVESARDLGSRDDASAVVLKIAADASAEDIDAMAQALASTTLFADLGDAERLLVAPYLDPVVLDAGEVLFTEGEPAESFYVVVDGEVRVTRTGTPLTEVGPGGSLGELCLAGPQIARSASATAISPVVAFRLTRERFHEVVARRPQIGARLLLRSLELVGDRLRDLTERLAYVEQLAVGEVRPGDLALRTAIVLAARGQWPGAKD